MTAVTMTKWSQFPNLRRRPPAPNKGHGRLQAAVKRAFVIGNGITTSSVVYDLAFVRRPARRLSHGNRRWIWIYLSRIADPIRRASTPGRPWVWKLRDPDA